MRIVITGTPGTGKSEVAKLLGKRLGIRVVDLKPFLERAKVGYDEKRKSDVIDEEKLVRLLKGLKGDFILEGHLTHYFPPDEVDLCVVLTCSGKELRERLRKRGWSEEKVGENVMAELVKVCLGEAMDRGHKPLVIDTTGKGAEEVVEEIVAFISERMKKKV